MNPSFAELLLNETPDAVIISTRDGAVAYWNRGAEAIFGYTAAEAVGRPIVDLIVPEERHAEERDVLKNLGRAEFSVFESIRHRKDGSLVYVAVSRKALRNAQGEIEHILSTKKDITHLKAVRDAKLVEAKFRDLLESMPDGILMANATGRIVLANGQAEAMFGYQRGELVGQLVETLLPARFRSGHVRHRSRYVEQPRPRAMGAGLELYGLRKEGTEFPVEISLNTVSTEEGTLVLSAIRDISDRKRTERELQEKNTALQEAARAKNRFLANMSHELRTPLNGIIGFAEFLSDGKPGPLNVKQKEYLGDILNSGRHLLQLINDILDLAKVEAGKMELAPEIFALREAIDEVIAVTEGIARKKRIRVTAQTAPELESVRLDAQKFKQILYNLLSNGIKFTDEGGAVDIFARPHEGGYLQLTVRDTGIGIRAEDMARLFGEFEQLESGASRRYEGTGLGLALTRKLVEMHEGSISVESQPGKGSSFIVMLPRDVKETT